MKIEVHLLSHDGEAESGMLDWSLRHYIAVADYVIIHDGGPTQLSSIRSMDIYAGDPPKLRFRPWDTGGQLNDDLARKLKNECWRGTDADWVVVADMDEFIHAPEGLRRRLARARAQGAAVLRPNGWEMFSDEWYDASEFPANAPFNQITELVRDGCPDDKWYAKPIVFSPKLVADSGFGIGAHESRPVLKDGRVLVCDGKWPFAGGLNLLHYKSIYGGLERIAAKYDATRKRLSALNVRCGFGNFAPGMDHAKEKREMLLARGVHRVVA
jgi:hypothetical protein